MQPFCRHRIRIAQSGSKLVKLDKLKGELVLHHHENEDEMFLVVKGTILIGLRENAGVSARAT